MTNKDKYDNELDLIDSKTTIIKDFEIERKTGFDKVQILCLVRDGSYYLEEFIKYHREIGVDQFVFLDNGSEDETIKILSKYSDVKILLNNLPYKKYWHLFKRFLYEYHGKGIWNLLIDIDEFFTCAFTSNLTDLIGYNNYFNFNAVVAQMVDLVPNESILNSKRAEDFLKTHIYYSPKDRRKDEYESILLNKNSISNASIKFHLGGWRNKEFGVGDIMLTKHPLIKGDDEVKYTHDHFVENARIGDYTTILRHYKFRAGFREYVDLSVKEENHFDNSREYKAYQKKLLNNNNMNLYQSDMEQINDIRTLFKNELFQVSSSYVLYFAESLNDNKVILQDIRQTILASHKEELSFENRIMSDLKAKHSGEIEKIKKSWSWKIGFGITRIFAPIFEFFKKN